MNSILLKLDLSIFPFKHCSVRSYNIQFYFLFRWPSLSSNQISSLLILKAYFKGKNLRILKRSSEQKVEWSGVRSYMKWLNGTIDRSNLKLIEPELWMVKQYSDWSDEICRHRSRRLHKWEGDVLSKIRHWTPSIVGIA